MRKFLETGSSKAIGHFMFLLAFQHTYTSWLCHITRRAPPSSLLGLMDGYAACETTKTRCVFEYSLYFGHLLLYFWDKCIWDFGQAPFSLWAYQFLRWSDHACYMASRNTAADSLFFSQDCLISAHKDSYDMERRKLIAVLPHTLCPSLRQWRAVPLI